MLDYIGIKSIKEFSNINNAFHEGKLIDLNKKSLEIYIYKSIIFVK